MQQSPRRFGIGDIAATLAGALAGYAMAQLMGLNPLAPGYDMDSLAGIILVGLGAGLGRRFWRQWRESDTHTNGDDDPPIRL